MVELYQHRAGAMKSTGAAEPKWGGDNNRFCLKHFCVIVDLGSFFDTGTDGHPGATLYCWTSLKLQKDCMDQIFTDPAVSSKWWIFRLWVNWPFRTNVNLSLSSEGGKMAWRHHFLVLLRLSRCIQVKFEKSERKPKRQRGRCSTAFIPFTTADSSTHFRLNQFSISRRQAFPHLQKQDKSGRIVASDSDQSAKVVPRVRPISDDQTPGANRSFTA